MARTILGVCLVTMLGLLGLLACPIAWGQPAQQEQNGQAGDQGEKQNGQTGAQGEKQNGQAGDQGENQNNQDAPAPVRPPEVKKGKGAVQPSANRLDGIEQRLNELLRDIRDIRQGEAKKGKKG